MLIWEAYSRKIDALAFAPDGRALALSGYHLGCRVIRSDTGHRLWTVGAKCGFGLSLAFGPGGSVLCRQSGVSVRTANTGAELRRCGAWCQSFALAPDGRTAFVADGGYQDLVRRYDLETGSAHAEVELESGAITRSAVSPDGKRLAVLGSKRFHLLAAHSFEVLATDAQRAFSSGTFALAFAPDGRTLVYSAGRTLFVCDATSAREMTQLQLETKGYTDAAFTPDGRRMVTVGKEGTAHVWDTATWACERSFAWNVGPLRAVAVAPDGARAAVAGDSGRVVVWDLDP
ncbi:WD domain, G-beta repeat [Gemmata sp. SH-PL17]|uniref:WD40 repeat domain-containing protein n=1 Tax=Gemmata sp. SH-PL17 TaxID=1630693 RepID=UPI00078E2225|nr:WD40 repeat domain-containing protein [Gemmata sp. SH-PL17]AMV22912.1 WD domain, G-beta repeat [Gemmata sp. SH-PL17]